MTPEQIRALILGATDANVVPLDVPEWAPNGTLYMRAMDSQHRRMWRAAASSSLDNGKVDHAVPLEEKLLAWTLCDAVGQLAFSEENVAELAGRNGMVIERVAMLAMHHNGLTAASKKELERD